MVTGGAGIPGPPSSSAGRPRADPPRLPAQEPHGCCRSHRHPQIPPQDEPRKRPPPPSRPCEDAARWVHACTRWWNSPFRPRLVITLNLLPTASLTCLWLERLRDGVHSVWASCQWGHLGAIGAPHACVLTTISPWRLREEPSKAKPVAGSPAYLPHLAVVLLVVGHVVWDLGSTRTRVGSAGETCHHRAQTPAQGGAHAEACGAPELWPLSHRCPRSLRGFTHAHSPHPLPGNTIRPPLSWRGQDGGKEGAPLPSGGPPELPGPRVTCEIRRNSCAFCRPDENSGLCCAPAWRTEEGKMLTAGACVGGLVPGQHGDTLPLPGTRN